MAQEELQRVDRMEVHLLSKFTWRASLFTNEKIIELIPDNQDERYCRASCKTLRLQIVDSMPDDVVEAIRGAGTSDSTQTLMKDLLSTTWRGRNPIRTQRTLYA